MAGAWTTKQIKDASGSNVTMRVWDESGSGSGPFSFGQTISDGGGVNAPGGINSNGQKTSANSSPVVLASDQPSIPTTTAVTASSNNLTNIRVVSAASTNATNLKASAGQIYTIDLFNVAAYTVFLKLYNKASSPTVGTDTPSWTIPIPAGSGYSKTFYFGLTQGTGISYAITKLQADSDTTVIAASDVTGIISWI